MIEERIGKAGGIEALARRAIGRVVRKGDEGAGGREERSFAAATEEDFDARGRGIGSRVDGEEESVFVEGEVEEAPVDEVSAHGGDERMRRGGAGAWEAREEAEADDARADAEAEKDLAAGIEGEDEEAGIGAEVSSLDASVEEGSEVRSEGSGEGSGHRGGSSSIASINRLARR